MPAITIQTVPLASVTAGLNDREVFNRGDLEVLAANIEVNGLLQPPLYRVLADGRYQIVLGERRTRACRDLLQQTEIQAFVTTLSDEDAIAAMGSENRCRVQLNPLEEAKGYQAGMARFGWDVATCAKRNGVSTRTVNDRLALLALCEDAQDLVQKGTLTPGYALVLAVAGLDRNMQNHALDLLKVNKSPNLDWWREAVQKIVLVSQQPAMFPMDAFMAGMVEDVQQAAERPLPDPETDMAPVIGDNPHAILGKQIVYWQDAAQAWSKRGRKQEAKRCIAAARSLALVNQALLALASQAPPVVVPMAPVVEDPPMASAPVDPPMAPPVDVLVEAITGRAGRVVCACGRRATHKIAYKETANDGLGRRLVVKTVCHRCLPDGVAPLVAGPAEQLAFVAA